MASQKNGKSKSDSIRDALKVNPSASVKDVVAVLAGQGVKVSAGQVYVVKRTAGKKAKRKKRRVLATSKAAAAGVPNPVALILSVRKVALEAGGMRMLKQLVDTLSE